MFMATTTTITLKKRNRKVTRTCHCTSLYVMYRPAVSLGLMIFTTCRNDSLVLTAAQIVTGRWDVSRDVTCPLFKPK